METIGIDSKTYRSSPRASTSAGRQQSATVQRSGSAARDLTLLGGSWVAVSGVISPLIWVIKLWLPYS